MHRGQDNRSPGAGKVLSHATWVLESGSGSLSTEQSALLTAELHVQLPRPCFQQELTGISVVLWEPDSKFQNLRLLTHM